MSRREAGHKEDEMLSRRAIVGSVAVVGLGLIVSVAAFAHGGPGRHGAVMKRYMSSMIDEALAPANVTPEQRTQIYAARDRAFAAVESHRQTRGAHLEEALRLFEADRVDAGQLTT